MAAVIFGRIRLMKRTGYDNVCSLRAADLQLSVDDVLWSSAYIAVHVWQRETSLDDTGE